MAKSRFDIFFDRAVAYEGKICEDVKGDNGGPTKWGITLGRYCDVLGVKTPVRGTAEFEKRKAELYALPEEAIRTIYRNCYWDAVRADDLRSGLDWAVADFGLNSGPSRAVKYLQRLMGNKQTGRMDDETLREANGWNTTELIDLYVDAREEFLRGIVRSDASQRKFLTGWLNRTASVRKTAKADINKAKEPPPPVVLPKAVPVEPLPPPKPPVKEVIKEEAVAAVKSPTNAIGAGGLLWLFNKVFDWTGWLYDQLPEMSSEVRTATEPLKVLGEATKTNLMEYGAAVAMGAIAIVLIRNYRNKKAKKALEAKLKELTDGEVASLA